ncbi:MAG: hypothetical protein M1480_16390 [Bacteroidetes bacterium]|nr:hypothetical protein [Bacteroidota bacterium]
MDAVLQQDLKKLMVMCLLGEFILKVGVERQEILRRRKIEQTRGKGVNKFFNNSQ